MGKHTTRVEQQSWIAAWRESGESMSRFAARRGRSANPGGREPRRLDSPPQAATAALAVIAPEQPAARQAAGVRSFARIPNCARCVPRRSNIHVR